MASDEMASGTAALRTQVQTILSDFHGKVTDITQAGRENMRTVNRLNRIISLRHKRTDKTFRHNLTYYVGEDLSEDIVIGAQREGQGNWSLVAEFVPRG